VTTKPLPVLWQGQLIFQGGKSLEFLVLMALVVFWAYKIGYEKGVKDEKYKYKRMMQRNRWK